MSTRCDFTLRARIVGADDTTFVRVRFRDNMTLGELRSEGEYASLVVEAGGLLVGQAERGSRCVILRDSIPDRHRLWRTAGRTRPRRGRHAPQRPWQERHPGRHRSGRGDLVQHPAADQLAHTPVARASEWPWPRLASRYLASAAPRRCSAAA
eukprot:scaffold241_cov229-Prasinococcus_capsulatus_cf.AAC.8